MTSDAILVVDDDSHVLSSFRRQLGDRFNLTTVQSGNEAIDRVQRACEAKKPFAVVICDMRMPGIDGVETLEEIRTVSPNTVRLMLTGNADQQTAIDAINRGQIFRFYTKPFPLDQLGDGLEAALEQYRLVTAEQELLEKTVTGSVRMLAELISINDPVAQGTATRLREWIRILQTNFNMPYRWQLEIAASLVPLTHVVLPPELEAKRRQGLPLSDAERSVFERAPELARDLISNIPRLAKVAGIIYLQDRGYDGSGFPADGPKGQDIPLDARVIKILKDLAAATGGGRLTEAALSSLDEKSWLYDPVLLPKVQNCLRSLAQGKIEMVVELPLAALRAGHVIISDLKLSNGHMIIAANTELSQAQISRLRALRKIFTFVEPIKVAEASLQKEENDPE